MAGLSFSAQSALYGARMNQERQQQQQNQLFNALGGYMKRQDELKRLEQEKLAKQASDPNYIGTIPEGQRTPLQQNILAQHQAKYTDVVPTEGGGYAMVNKLGGGAPLMNQPQASSPQRSLYGALGGEGYGDMLQPPSVGGERVGLQPLPNESPKTRQLRQEAELELQKELTVEEAKARMAKKSEMPAADDAFKFAMQKTGDVEQTIDQAIKQSNRFNTGPIMGRNPMATNMGALLDTIQADAAFGELQRMREASKTGGALGSVSERELALLSSAQAALQQSQTEDQLDANLERYKQIRKRALENTAEAYKRDYGEYPSSYKSQNVQDSGSASKIKLGTVEDGYKYIGGDPAKPNSWKKVQ